MIKFSRWVPLPTNLLLRFAGSFLSETLHRANNLMFILISLKQWHTKAFKESMRIYTLMVLLFYLFS